MAIRFIPTDDEGNGYNIDDDSGDVYDQDANLLDQTTAAPEPSTGGWIEESADASTYGDMYNNAANTRNVSTDTSGGSGFDLGNFLSGLGTKAKSALLDKDGGLTPLGQRLLGGVIGGGIAGIMAPKNAGTPQMFQAGAAPGFVNMNKKLVRTPVANRTGGNYFNTTYAAKGGMMPGQSDAGSTGGLGFYLGGPTDGMADKVDATIGDKRPAKLAHGEFVIPADVVSHLGNGNSDAGAKALYAMMANIRKARTGNAKQGKRIDPRKFMPGGKKMAEGGIAAFAIGGTVPAGTVGTEQNVSNWAAPYVGDMLGSAAAVANAPYVSYQGPLTAGPSALQTQGFGAAGNLQTPAGVQQAGAAAGAIGQQAVGAAGNTFDTAAAQKYMNPYLSSVLTPQLAEMRRQSQISQMGNDAKMAGAGAFGGDRQAIMTAENQRNLMQQQDTATGAGYKNAYDAAMGQYNADQNRQLTALGVGLQGAQTQGNMGIAENQANLANLNTQLGAGATQRDIAQQGITADVNAFNAERDDPMRRLAFQKAMLEGLPITATGYATQTPSLMQEIAGGALGGLTLADILGGRDGGTTKKP